MLFIKGSPFKHKKRFMEKMLIKFKKISIDKVYEIIINECEEDGVVVEKVSKSKNQLILRIIYKKKSFILKFHKALVVTMHDYEELINQFNLYKVNRAFYITTGVFQQDVYNKNYNQLLQKQVVLLNGDKFIRKQSWMKLKEGEHINYNKLSFKKYFPK